MDDISIFGSQNDRSLPNLYESKIDQSVYVLIIAFDDDERQVFLCLASLFYSTRHFLI